MAFDTQRSSCKDDTELNFVSVFYKCVNIPILGHSLKLQPYRVTVA